PCQTQAKRAPLTWLPDSPIPLWSGVAETIVSRVKKAVAEIVGKSAAKNVGKTGRRMIASGGPVLHDSMEVGGARTALPTRVPEGAIEMQPFCRPGDDIKSSNLKLGDFPKRARLLRPKSEVANERAAESVSSSSHPSSGNGRL